MRQALKLIKVQSIFSKSYKFGYATETKNVFTLPRRQYLHPQAINEVTAAITQAYTTKQLAYLFRDNIKHFLDLHVANLYHHIQTNNLELDDTINSIIIPITIEYVNSFTIANAGSLGQIALCANKLNLDHEGLWQAILNKLDTQNIYRYLTLQQTVFLFNNLIQKGTYINHSLVKKLSIVINQQREYYNNFPQYLKLINQANKILQEKGQKTLQISQAQQQIAA